MHFSLDQYDDNTSNHNFKSSSLGENIGTSIEFLLSISVGGPEATESA